MFKFMKKNKTKILGITILILFIIIIVLSFDNIKMKKSKREEYLFLGDSITSRYNLQTHFSKYPIINSGIGGNKTIDVLENLDNRVFKYSPSKVILLIGINDFAHNEKIEYVDKNISRIIENIHKHLPKCNIYVESIYPINQKWEEMYATSTSPSVKDINDNVVKENEKIKSYCKKNNYKYIDVYSQMVDSEGYLKEEYSDDGIHLNEEAYKIVTYTIKRELFY